jgi:hypothetical protein
LAMLQRTFGLRQYNDKGQFALSVETKVLSI